MGDVQVLPSSSFHSRRQSHHIFNHHRHLSLVQRSLILIIIMIINSIFLVCRAIPWCDKTHHGLPLQLIIFCRCNFPGSRAFGAISTYNMHRFKTQILLSSSFGQHCTDMFLNCSFARAEVDQIYHRLH